MIFPHVIPVSFSTVLPIWRDMLWPCRKSPIQPVSTMMLFGGYDMTIKEWADEAAFFGVYDDAEDLVGVFSGHPTSDMHYRARGLYVRSDMRAMGVGRALVQRVVNAASEAGRSICWCLPRVTNVPFFMQIGFTQVSEPVSDGMEFGPNVYMTRAINPLIKIRA